MGALTNRDLQFIEKLHQLPDERRAVLEQLVDAFLRTRTDRAERALTEEAGLLSESALREIWDNPEDAIYDHL